VPLADAKMVWVLQAVTIKTSSGTVTGYTAWLDERPNLSPRESLPVYPRSRNVDDAEMTRILRSQLYHPFYSTILKVPYPKEMLVTTSQETSIRDEFLDTVRPATSPLNGFSWEGRIEQVSPAKARLLERKPRYVCKTEKETCGDGACFYFYLLSYTSQYGARDFKPLCKSPELINNGSIFFKEPEVPGIVFIRERTI